MNEGSVIKQKINHLNTAQVGGQAEVCAAFSLDTETVFIDETRKVILSKLSNPTNLVLCKSEF
jgi:hypothetical protein